MGVKWEKIAYFSKIRSIWYGNVGWNHLKWYYMWEIKLLGAYQSQIKINFSDIFIFGGLPPQKRSRGSKLGKISKILDIKVNIIEMKGQFIIKLLRKLLDEGSKAFLAYLDWMNSLLRTKSSKNGAKKGQKWG